MTIPVTDRSSGDVLAFQLLKLGSDIPAEEIDLLPFIDVVDPLNHQRFRSGHRIMHRCFIANPRDAQQTAEALAGTCMSPSSTDDCSPNRIAASRRARASRSAVRGSLLSAAMGTVIVNNSGLTVGSQSMEDGPV